jgi:8-oxo-dGTP diphosphatase
MPFTYDYPRPALVTDCVLLSICPNGDASVLLIERQCEPFAGFWALPGGFVEEGEDLVEGARRELLEETGLEVPHLRQIGAFGKPGRDPRKWVVSVAFGTLIDAEKFHPSAGSDAREVRWFPLAGLPQLAFDHSEIIAEAVRLLLLPPTF